MTQHEDVERQEHELAADLATPLAAMRARHAHCPPLDLLRASAGDALSPEHRTAIDDHLRDCLLCRTLAADLQVDELTAPTANDTQRVRSRVEAQRRDTPAFQWAWIWRPALAAAAVTLVAWMVWTTPTPIRPAATTAVSAPAASPVVPEAIPFEMPELRLRASMVLVTRGDADARRYVADLAPALNAYRAADYAAAAREFSALESAYPNEIEVFFYGGVSSLHQAAGAAGVRSLERALTLEHPEFADEVRWYLGLAYQRAENAAAAREQFVTLCAGRGNFAARACDVADRLGK